MLIFPINPEEMFEIAEISYTIIQFLNRTKNKHQNYKLWYKYMLWLFLNVENILIRNLKIVM